MSRLIQDSMWGDEFFTSMSIFDRLLWVGLITVCADDQGRFQDSAAMIRSRVFPIDDIQVKQIEDALHRYSEEGKIIRYIVGKHKCIQIANWWKHQRPQWAGKSIYPKHKDWVDRMRYHVTKKDIVNINWDKPGGFPIDYIDHQVEAKLPDDVKYDVDIEDDVEGDVNNSGGAPISPIQLILEKITGIPPSNAEDVKAMDEIAAMNPLEEDITAALTWLNGQGKKMYHYRSIVNPIRVSIATRVQVKKPHPNSTEAIQEANRLVIEQILQEEALKNG